MNVEIYGAKFINKGAELMLLSCVKKINQELNSPNIVLNCSKYSEWKILSKKKFHKRLVYIKHHFFFDLGCLIPKIIRKKYNIILTKEIDLFLDASGFAYGDYWSYKLPLILAKQLKIMKKNRAKIFFLPQAFGSFDNLKISTNVFKMLSFANNVFSRDIKSHSFLKNINIKSKICPDFTFEIKPDKLNNDFSNKICLIPNSKIIDSNDSSGTKNQYLTFFRLIINFFSTNNYECFLLNHEGKKDLDLCFEISKSCNISIINNKDALAIKSIIGSSKIVIGSRYHGLASALNQGVPTIGIGWSHKYKYLFDDYDFSFGLLNLNITKDNLLFKLNKLIEQKFYNESKKELKKD